jgi:hypothetical protein
MVGAGGEMVAIVPVRVDADPPRIGGHDFVARPWGSDRGPSPPRGVPCWLR